MKIKERTYLFNKADAAWRYSLLNTATRVFPSVVLTEFPKSGGTWFCQMLTEYTKIPYPRNQLPSIGSNIYQGHFLKRYPCRTIVLWRDPRDILISLYHFLYFKTEYVTQARVDAARRHANFKNFDDVVGNLPAFIELYFSNPMVPRFSWNAFFDAWNEAEDVTHTSYERLRIDTVGELDLVANIAGETLNHERLTEIVERYSFRRVSGRKEGQEDRNSFLRKGIVGDWMNVFSPEAINKLEEMTAGRLERYDQLIKSFPSL